MIEQNGMVTYEDVGRCILAYWIGIILEYVKNELKIHDICRIIIIMLVILNREAIVSNYVYKDISKEN